MFEGGVCLKINSRRYTGNKYRLMSWIKRLILEYCPEHEIFFDVFGGTGVVTAEMLDVVQSAIVNDFLYSNEICYKAFFGYGFYDVQKLKQFADEVAIVDRKALGDNYVSLNYGGRYFEYGDAKLIGAIREKIQSDYVGGGLNEREFSILLASLLYSFDRCANTVGHYDAYIKKSCQSNFVFELIEPIFCVRSLFRPSTFVLSASNSSLLAALARADFACSAIALASSATVLISSA